MRCLVCISLKDCVDRGTGGRHRDGCSSSSSEQCKVPLGCLGCGMLWVLQLASGD